MDRSLQKEIYFIKVIEIYFIKVIEIYFIKVTEICLIENSVNWEQLSKTCTDALDHIRGHHASTKRRES